MKRERPEFEPLLREATSAQEAYQRRNALESLVRHWRLKPQTVGLLVQAARSAPAYEVRVSAVEALGKYWCQDPPIRVLLQEKAKEDSSDCVRNAAIRGLIQNSRTGETFALLYDRATNDSSDWVRSAAISMLLEHWRQEAAVFPLLREGARSDSTDSVRSAALKGIIDGYQEHPETLPLLMERAVADPNVYVRLRAARALANWQQDARVVDFLFERTVAGERWARDDAVWAVVLQRARQKPNYLGWLKGMAREGKDEDLRRRAIQTLAQDGREDPESLGVLCTLGISEPSTTLRWSALRALAEGWPEHREVRKVFIERVQQEPMPNVRRYVVEESARRWPADDEVQTLLQERSVRDGNGEIRQIILRELKSRGAAAEFHALCAERLKNDPYWPARREALQMLVRLWPESPDTRMLLMQTAQADESCYVRRAALQLLIECGRTDEALFTLYYERAANDPDGRMQRNAVLQILRWKPDVPATRDLLLQLARRQRDWEHEWIVLPAVRRALLRYWKDDPEVQKIIPQATNRSRGPKSRWWDGLFGGEPT